MSAKEAKEYGLIDGVITNPLKAFKPLSPEELAKLKEEIPTLEGWKNQVSLNNFPPFKSIES